jgi:23S rRNA (cytosine1962-C5)-methyltransferase
MPESFPALVLKPGRERSLINRHPWVFSGAVGQEPKAEDGAIVQVTGADGSLLGYGHYSPLSQIRCRMFQFSQEALTFDDAYWQGRFDAALDLRESMLDLEETDGYRLIFAEGDGLPGVICDRYADSAVLQLRTAGARTLEALLVEWLKGLGIEHIYLKGEKVESKKNPTGEGDSRWLLGGVETMPFVENGLQFQALPVDGQKTGFFLDQRGSRELVMQRAEGRTVLECFSYTGGFGIYALAGGAASVTALDASAAALNQASEHAIANFGEEVPHSIVQADCFDYLKELEPEQFDLIILDPPAFSKRVGTVDKAARGYKDLNLKAIKKLPPGGLLFTFSCSQHVDRDLFRKIVYGAAADAKRTVRILGQMTQGADHPIDIYHPEGEYLKGIFLIVD